MGGIVLKTWFNGKRSTLLSGDIGLNPIWTSLKDICTKGRIRTLIPGSNPTRGEGLRISSGYRALGGYGFSLWSKKSDLGRSPSKGKEHIRISPFKTKGMAGINAPMTFTVRRSAPELIIPTKPTPRELKPLSDNDDQTEMRYQTPVILVYRINPKMRNKNPASVIREALAKLLVFYYPFAGRLKEGPTGRLVVDCSSEGALFIEAEADATLDHLGDALQPPFPCLEELLYNVPGSDVIVGSPLLLIQVTRLLCGGFIFAIRFNHTICDATGLAQFLSGLAEIARGATSPSTLPVWQRELLCSSDRPYRTSNSLEIIEEVYKMGGDDMVLKSLFFTKTDILALRRLVPIHQQSCSSFALLTACIWRCRTVALQPDPKEDMPIIWALNARKMFNPPLPKGYYGNVLAFPSATSTARDLCNKPLGYALELVTKANSDVTKEYIRSISDLMESKGLLQVTTIRDFLISNLTHMGFDAVDFGWGKVAYEGAVRGVYAYPISSFFVHHKNNNGESGIVLPIVLQSGVMDKFVKEINNMIAQGKNDEVLLEHKLPVVSKQ